MPPQSRPVGASRLTRRAMRLRGIHAGAIVLALVLTTTVVPSANALTRADTSDLASRGWIWPAAAFRLDRAFVSPAHRYGAGHRGIDLLLVDQFEVRAPADGTVAFSGLVAGRGILTIDHGDGLVTTLEPVESDLGPGAVVERGDEVGTLALGGHAEPGRVHFGVRLDGEYINPMLLLGGVPRAVLLPCC